jgi:hypothetical protein
VPEPQIAQRYFPLVTQQQILQGLYALPLSFGHAAIEHDD